MPSILFPANPTIGDTYDHEYLGQITTWNFVAPGVWETDTIGAEGNPGPSGRGILSGDVAPTDEGVDGDFYIHRTEMDLYGPKTAGDWGDPTSMIGPEGPISTEPGPIGPPGPTILVPNTQTTSYTTVLSDAGKVIEMNSSSATTCTIPTNSVAYDIGALIEVYRMGTGTVQIVPTATVTIRNISTGFITNQYGSVSLRKRATNEWVLVGQIT